MIKGIFFTALITGFLFLPVAAEETPEHIYNMATDAMTKGEDAVAIQLFYKVTEEYPNFKKYRADALYMLGQLLFKTERYDEAEKTFSTLISKYKKYQKIDKAYEYLIYIYTEEFNDNEKAKKIRDLYAKEFGTDRTLTNIDRTMDLLDKERNYDMLKLDASNMEISRFEEATDFQTEIFPILCYKKDKAMSNDKSMSVERKKTRGGYYLFLNYPRGKNGKKVPDSKNGYMPQWAWDGKYVIFTSMNWDTMLRRIMLYDLEKNKTKVIFRAKKIDPLLCFSPDSSKIIFIFEGKLWITNRDGGNISKLNNKITVKDAFVMAWAKEGDKLLLKEDLQGSKYKICYLTKRELK